jgi:hypothetical protein
VREVAQADPAESELPVVGAWAAATAASVVRPGLVLRLALLSYFLGSLGHIQLLFVGCQ